MFPPGVLPHLSLSWLSPCPSFPSPCLSRWFWQQLFSYLLKRGWNLRQVNCCCLSLGVPQRHPLPLASTYDSLFFHILREFHLVDLRQFLGLWCLHPTKRFRRLVSKVCFHSPKWLLLHILTLKHSFPIVSFGFSLFGTNIWKNARLKLPNISTALLVQGPHPFHDFQQCNNFRSFLVVAPASRVVGFGFSFGSLFHRLDL